MSGRRWPGFIVTALVFGGFRLLYEQGWITYFHVIRGDSSIISYWAWPVLAGTFGALWYPVRQETRPQARAILGLAALAVLITEVFLGVSEVIRWYGKTLVMPGGTEIDLFQARADHANLIVPSIVTIWAGLIGGSLTMLLHILRLAYPRLSSRST